MDPNENLAEQRRLLERHANGTARLADYQRLADLADALNEWITGGGFLPKAWERKA